MHRPPGRSCWREQMRGKPSLYWSWCMRRDSKRCWRGACDGARPRARASGFAMRRESLDFREPEPVHEGEQKRRWRTLRRYFQGEPDRMDCAACLCVDLRQGFLCLLSSPVQQGCAVRSMMQDSPVDSHEIKGRGHAVCCVCPCVYHLVLK